MAAVVVAAAAQADLSALTRIAPHRAPVRALGPWSGPTLLADEPATAASKRLVPTIAGRVCRPATRSVGQSPSACLRAVCLARCHPRPRPFTPIASRRKAMGDTNGPPRGRIQESVTLLPVPGVSEGRNRDASYSESGSGARIRTVNLAPAGKMLALVRTSALPPSHLPKVPFHCQQVKVGARRPGLPHRTAGGRRQSSQPLGHGQRPFTARLGSWWMRPRAQTAGWPP